MKLETTKNNLEYLKNNNVIKHVFIDDDRFPVEIGTMYIIRSFSEFKEVFPDYAPTFISFDHDLGNDLDGTGYDIAKYIVDLDMTNGNILSSNFKFCVHSQNPVGRQNIIGYLDNYLSFIRR